MTVLWLTTAFRESAILPPKPPCLPFHTFRRATGIEYCIREGQYGQDIFTLRSTYFERHPQAPIHMHWRRFKVSSIPLDTLDDFHAWLIERWNEKEVLLEEHARTGRFPSSIDSVTTEVRLDRWWEILQLGAILAPLIAALFACARFIGWVRSG